jgi:hypothetical protein
LENTQPRSWDKYQDRLPDTLAKQIFKGTNRSKGAKNLDDFALTLSPRNREKVLRDGIKVMERYQIPVSRLAKRELTHLTQLRLQKQITRKQILSISQRLSKRIVTNTTRNVALSQPQAITGVLAPLALAMVAWDLYDACRMIEDLSELEGISQITLTDNDRIDEDVSNKALGISIEGIDEKVCGMSRSELVAKITGKDPKFDACVVARLDTNSIDPPECDGFEFTTLNFEDDKIKDVSHFEAPNFD